VAGRWARLKGDYRWIEEPRSGHWHRIRSHDPARRTVSLESAGETLDVNIAYLALSADPPTRTMVRFESPWASHPPDGPRCLAVCPRGHERTVGAAPVQGDRCLCTICGTESPWEWC
jgi:hypothetical protein